MVLKRKSVFGRAATSLLVGGGQQVGGAAGGRGTLQALGFAEGRVAAGGVDRDLVGAEHLVAGRASGRRIALACQVEGHQLTLALDRHQAALLEQIAELLENFTGFLSHLKETNLGCH